MASAVHDEPPATKADHFCVLVHGLWGNPSHLDYVASALKERHGDSVYILVAKRNAGHFTYDGIELGGERLAHEVEEALDELAKEGYNFRKLSIVGYSLGGLVARYAIGLLDARGWLGKLEPVNFTTFATPHVGVRAPATGIRGHIWNSLAPRTISMSGKQLFLIDSFRDTGKPLLSVLADPESIFIKALAKFKHRSAYANIINDRSAVFYTTFITAVDPFNDLDSVNLNYVKGYERVILDPDVPVLPSKQTEPEPLASQIWRRVTRIFNKLPLWLFVATVLPIILVIFLGNSVIQTIRSRQRIRLHEEGTNGILFGSYKVPLLVQDMRHVMEDAFENANSRQDPEYIGFKGRRALTEPSTTVSDKPSRISDIDQSSSPALSHNCGDTMSKTYATLALTPSQLAIIDSLNKLSFRKYPVYIHNHMHSHAAIVVRIQKKAFDEGRLVIKHWLDNEFED
ncbi:lipase serine esterase [Aspergillus sclerotialis]|uniref:Lipase serine esterase n=1 Tax=Aspergillus sclerotialis TaxID=2070753 RepID=A0A3A2ZP73_9EURO|nr:lipase serine esterase [Aspergillus sclerotialis]